MCPELPYSKSAVWAGRETVDLDIKTLLPLYFTSKAANQDLPRFKENRVVQGNMDPSFLLHCGKICITSTLSSSTFLCMVQWH